MRRLASYALVAAIALAAAGCAGSRVRVVASAPPVHLVRDVDNDNRIGPGPFVLGGGWAGGGESGLWGDGGNGPRGTSLGCLDNRHYSYAFGLKNTLNVPVTLIAAIGPNPAPGIVNRVATQLRLSPPQRRPSGVPNWGWNGAMDLVYHRWSAAPTRPVTIPRHRIATIQVNFLMHHCDALVHGRTITVSGALALKYHASGHNGRQLLRLPENRFVVRAAPKRRSCTPVSGSASLVTADVGCAFAQRAAPICRAMKNEDWLGCTVAGRYWDCGRFAGPGYPLLETCYLPHQKARWFRVVWVGHGLGLWGAIQNRRANLGWNRIDAWHTTRGICQTHSGLGLFFESSALRILRGKEIARVPADARVRFAIRKHGPGRFSAKTVVEVVMQRGGSYVATGGRLTITRATKGSIAGTLYASLRHGTKQAFLNGTWSCRIAH